MINREISSYYDDNTRRKIKEINYNVMMVLSDNIDNVIDEDMINYIGNLISIFIYMYYPKIDYNSSFFKRIVLEKFNERVEEFNRGEDSFIVPSRNTDNNKFEVEEVEYAEEPIPSVDRICVDDLVKAYREKSVCPVGNENKGIKLSTRKIINKETLIRLIAAGTIVCTIVGSVLIFKHKKEEQCIDTAINYYQGDIVSLYDKLTILEDDEYRLIGFYLEYYELDKAGNDTFTKLAIMEQRFSECIDMAKKSNLEMYSIINGKKTMLNSIKSYCFLDFVYERLRENGYNFVDNELYKNALIYYKTHSYISELKTSDKKDISRKNAEDAIEKVMKTYCKISRPKAIVTGDIIGDINNKLGRNKDEKMKIR